MSGLLSGPDDGPETGAPCDALFVDGVRYVNSAAKFWPALVDEAREAYPDCRHIRLAAPTAQELEPDHLFPALSFEKHYRELARQDLGRLMREIVAELDLLGSPAPVRVELLDAGERVLLEKDLPLECVDAESFLFLLVWPLKWAGVPASQWNNEVLSADLAAEDRGRGRTYGLSFTIRNRHLSEGLYRREVSLQFHPA